MRRLIKSLGGIISTLQKRSQYGTIPARQYVPAGQQPLRQRCPGDQHTHAGYPYCHPSQRKHRVASAELHQEGSRVERIKHAMDKLGEKMTQRAVQRKKVPERWRQDYHRMRRYIDRLQGRK